MWELILCNFITGNDKTYRYDDYDTAVQKYKLAVGNDVPCILTNGTLQAISWSVQGAMVLVGNDGEIINIKEV